MRRIIVSKLAVLVLNTLLVLLLCSCTTKEKKAITKKPYFDSKVTENYDVTQKQLEIDEDTKIIIDEIDKKSENYKEEDINERLSAKNSCYEVILYNVIYDLEKQNFECSLGQIQDVDNNEFANGIYYYDPEIKIFANYDSCGFYELLEAGQSKFSIDDSKVYEVVDLDNGNEFICSYNYTNIKASHFIYKNKYVKYYLESQTVIRYEILDNDRLNYNLNFGNLYSYDDNLLIYDETFFDEYQTHNGFALTTNTDYDAIKDKVQELLAFQDENGLNIDEITIAYISPEALEMYVNGDDNETFFGYDVAELEKGLGKNTALEYKNGSFVESKIIEQQTGYNWKKFLTKIGIGCGIIIIGAIGAVLSPYTGGTSFACAMLAITKIAVTTALVGAAIELCVTTLSSFAAGKSIKDSLKDGVYAGLDAFSTGFIVGAVLGSIGVISGAVKPSSCFIGSTLINTINGSKKIEDIREGDYVYSYNSLTGMYGYNLVTETFVNKTNALTHIIIGDNEIITTPNHPFYDSISGDYVRANYIDDNVELLGSNGNIINADYVYTDILDEEVEVYNFTVDNYHTYFVGEDEILVHNDCTINTKRNKAVRDAWKERGEGFANGDYAEFKNLTSEQLAEFSKTGRISGYEGHHIIPVNQVVGTESEYLISSADNIVFATKQQHTYIHAIGDGLETTSRVVELFPELAGKVASLLALLQ